VHEICWQFTPMNALSLRVSATTATLSSCQPPGRVIPRQNNQPSSGTHYQFMPDFWVFLEFARVKQRVLMSAAEVLIAATGVCCSTNVLQCAATAGQRHGRPYHQQCVACDPQGTCWWPAVAKTTRICPPPSHTQGGMAH